MNLWLSLPWGTQSSSAWTLSLYYGTTTARYHTIECSHVMEAALSLQEAEEIALQKMWSLTRMRWMIVLWKGWRMKEKEPVSKPKARRTRPPSETMQRQTGWGCATGHSLQGGRPSHSCVAGSALPLPPEMLPTSIFMPTGRLLEAIKGSTPRRTQEWFRKTSKLLDASTGLPPGWEGWQRAREALFGLQGPEADQNPRSWTRENKMNPGLGACWALSNRALRGEGEERTHSLSVFIPSRRAEAAFWPALGLCTSLKLNICPLN